MKFKIRSSELKNFLKKIVPIIKPTNPLDILTQAKIRVAENTLEIDATDLNIWIKGKYPVLSDGKLWHCCANVRLLYNTLINLDDVELTIERIDNRLNVTWEYGQYQLACQDVGDFPRMPGENFKKLLSVSDSEFVKSLKNARLFASVNEQRPAFRSICLGSGDGKMEVVATEGHTLYLKKFDIEFNLPNIKLPLQVIDHIKDFENLEIYVDKKLVKFVSDNYEIICSQIDDTYPNYRSVIPTKFIGYINTDRKLLGEVVKRVSIYSFSKLVKANLKLDQGDFVVTSSDVDKQAIEKITDFDTDLTEFNKTLKMEDIVNALDVLDEDRVKIIATESEMVLMSNENGNDTIILIMPIREI